MSVYLSVIVAVVGVLVYAFSTNAKLQEIGRISFAFGLLVFLLQVDKIVSVLGSK